MEPIIAFTLVMLVWTIGEFVSKKTEALISMMLVASVIFLIGFATDLFPHDLIQDSGLLGIGNAVIGVIIVHLGTTMSIEDLKSQWRTFVIGSLTVVIMTLLIFAISSVVFDRNVAIAGTASITGGTLSILMVQDKVAEITANGGSTGMMQAYILAVFPLLILNLKNLVGFLVSANILKKEARRVQKEYREGHLHYIEEEVIENSQPDKKNFLPEALLTPYGTLFMLGLTMYIARLLSSLTQGYVNAFVIALLLGILLRHFHVLQPNALSKTDSFGLLMISIMVIAFGPLADIVPADLLTLIFPILFFLLLGVLVILVTSFIIGKQLGYSAALSMAVGLTTLFGFPGTMVLTKEAAASVGENEAECAVIEQNILPIMVTAGFSTITITSVITGGLLVNLMIGL
jgi:hypothetical protein